MRISFDCAAELYDKSRGLPKPVMRRLVKALVGQLEGYQTILDAGVGTGRLAGPLQNSGFFVVGVDIARRMIEKAAEKDVENLIQGDVCFLPFKEKSFDVTVCTHVLHLISEWITALEEICRVTRKIVVSTNYVRKSPLREAYKRLIRRYGYESHYPGKGEWELKDLVKPNTIPVTSYERGLDKSLDYMTQRAYSSQWEIPEDVNKKVIDELKHRFGGTAFLQELQILVWDVDELEDFCMRTRF